MSFLVSLLYKTVTGGTGDRFSEIGEGENNY
jgi:hypothetical protein